MTNKKYLKLIAITGLLAAFTTSTAFAQDNTSNNGNNNERPGFFSFLKNWGRGNSDNEQNNRGNKEGRGLGDEMGRRVGQIPMMQRGVFGTVTSISGNTLTITSKMGTSTTPITYTVDATNAKVLKAGNNILVSNIAVGDTVMVEGKVTGTNVVATIIRDGVPNMPPNWAGNDDKNERPKPGQNVPLFQGNGQPVVGGKITSVSGTSITITNVENATYTVDAANANIIKGGATTSVSSLVVGDSIIVQGTINGTSVKAAQIIYQGARPFVQANVPKPPEEKRPGFFGNFFGRIFGF